MRQVGWWSGAAVAFGVGVMACLGPCGGAAAARFDVVSLPDGGRALQLSGYLETGDQTAFHAIAALFDGDTVMTTGPGGSVLAATTIGNEIRARGWTTVVPPNADCASACAMVWLAGARRRMGDGARIGFHALAVQANGTLTETHRNDVDLRRWLDQLGYSYDTTATIVKTPSALVHWFDAIELRANGIEVDSFP